MIDQYGKQIPEDLVFIVTETKNLSDYDIHKIMSATWYEIVLSGAPILAASKKEINEACDQFVFNSIQEDEIQTAKAYLVNDVVKSFHKEKGFYLR